MRVAFLSAYSSTHTVKWVNEMAVRGHDVHLITMHKGTGKLRTSIDLHKLPFKAHLGYYLNVYHLKLLLRAIMPDILNVHYASGYGTLARLVDFHPYLLSVWGSDVFEFPYGSRLKMRIIRNNLKAADRIASTSHAMKKQVINIYRPQKEIIVTPFGVDCNQFTPVKHTKGQARIRIGTVKSMAPKYGISTLIEAFAIVKKQFTGDIELVLVGDGQEKEDLKLLAKNLNVIDYVDFAGSGPHDSVPDYLNSFDIFVALSASESFGVAIVEASACGIPVVVSNVGGLPEVVVDNITGYLVPFNNPQVAADKIFHLLNNPLLRMEMGKAGRQFVLDHYDWEDNADQMEQLYNTVVGEHKQKQINST